MKFRVLLIDDDEMLCETTKLGLEQIGGFEVGFATSGKSGILMAKKGAPDIILLDVCMPKMNGIEVLKTLKSQYPLSEIPVIMLSGLLDESTKAECDYHYGEDYVEKPADLANLISRIETVLRRTGKLPPLRVAAVC